MNLVKNITTQVIRNHRQFLVQCSRFATDAKQIEDLTKKNKVVVFMKVRFSQIVKEILDIPFKYLFVIIF